MIVPEAHLRQSQQPTVAVVLCWNDAERVAGLLERLGTLRPRPDRILVVDNGSTGDAARRLPHQFPEIELLALPENRGFAGAANVGIARALELGAHWVWLLNTDIDLPADALAHLSAAASSSPRCGMAGAVLVNAGGDTQAWGGGHVSLHTGTARHARTEDAVCDYLSGACLLMRAAMLREIGPFDERYFFSWEDIELGFRARAAGWSLAVAKGCRVLHDEGSTLGAWSRARWYHLFRGMIRFLESRSPRPRMAAAARLAGHSVAMVRHGRRDALAGAWTAAWAEIRSREWTGYPT